MTQTLLHSLFQHVATTSGVSVRVAAAFMADQSRIEAGRWFWTYHIRIENNREDLIHLRTRHWRISDSNGMVNVVDGEGVVGETPLLTPNETFDYVSGCELTTDQGAMEGHFTFARQDGSLLDVAIPRFELAVPI